MAKGKRGSGNNYTSKGERRNVARKTRNAMRREYMESSLQRIINQAQAHNRGKKTMVTIANPNKNETNKRFIKVPGSEVFKQSGRR